MISVNSDLSVELPFTLTHPKPKDSPPLSHDPSVVSPAADSEPIDANLIEFDTKSVDPPFAWLIVIVFSFICAQRVFVLRLRTCVRQFNVNYNADM